MDHITAERITRVQSLSKDSNCVLCSRSTGQPRLMTTVIHRHVRCTGNSRRRLLHTDQFFHWNWFCMQRILMGHEGRASYSLLPTSRRMHQSIWSLHSQVQLDADIIRDSGDWVRYNVLL